MYLCRGSALKLPHPPACSVFQNPLLLYPFATQSPRGEEISWEATIRESVGAALPAYRQAGVAAPIEEPAEGLPYGKATQTSLLTTIKRFNIRNG